MKIVLKEEQLQSLKLPPFIYKAIMSKNTSIGDNPALPPVGEFGLEYDIIKTKFKDTDEIITKYIERGKLESKDTDYLISVLNKRIEQCKRIEKTIAPQLEKLCENIVNEYFSIPEDTVIIKCNLTDKIKPKNNIRILPENDEAGNAYDFEDADEVDMTNKAILKRRFINALIQGFSYWLSTDIDKWKDVVDGLNNELWGIWCEIINISNYLLFVKKEEISEKNPNQIAYVEVHLGKNGKKTTIEAQGLVFPFLLRETIRGFFELFSSHGLPDDNRKAMFIIKKSDFLVAEPWDLRIGMGLIDLLQNNITKKYGSDILTKTNKLPYFFSSLCSFKFDDFNDTMRNLLIGTNKGKREIDHINSEIVHDFEYHLFKDRIQQKNISTSVISDDCFTKEELGNYVLQENNVDEYTAYHGSGSDFDKFNHKKYLNTGAGSQTFGWGTYVTNDMAVAKGYADNAKQVSNDKVDDEIINILKQKYGYDVISAVKEASDILYNLRWAGSLKEFIEICKKSIETDWETDERKEMHKRWIDVLTQLSTKNSYIYEVDIPDDNGQNYIEWYEYFPPYFMKRILQGFLKIPDRFLNSIAANDYPFKCDLYQDIQWMKENPENADKMINIICSNDDYEDFFSSSYYTNKSSNEGKNVYRRLQTLFGGSEKAASLFLMQCGFDGIKYPSGTKWQKPDGAAEDAYNYVLFDANKVKIVNKTEA